MKISENLFALYIEGHVLLRISDLVLTSSHNNGSYRNYYSYALVLRILDSLSLHFADR
jgi:hypothetical protein